MTIRYIAHLIGWGHSRLHYSLPPTRIPDTAADQFSGGLNVSMRLHSLVIRLFVYVSGPSLYSGRSEG